MYPDNALGEFYPDWLIKEAEQHDRRTLAEIHAYCTPRIKFMDYFDKGPEWLAANYTDGCIEGAGI